jgi:hypothetical protein
MATLLYKTLLNANHQVYPRPTCPTEASLSHTEISIEPVQCWISYPSNLTNVTLLQRRLLLEIFVTLDASECQSLTLHPMETSLATLSHSQPVYTPWFQFHVCSQLNTRFIQWLLTLCDVTAALRLDKKYQEHQVDATKAHQCHSNNKCVLH